ncbi:hypothetical protein K450DRAFT_232649 [Umbelopsis ramanniana AG]|uniref:CCHC-type domain-containing protein n=1 Tax=Umbelopsis ramanniana AG TaxID=1314678 RepID=A0AAD5HEE5_UMBRA|nr:uncharacterized protein K450DRAFT_232649 [Umbelopsis ramanniana AG]KAI8581355.1 hypothetical protein K450DRAFT_232649 [Umbelopsis ramanniana AG]
MAITNFLNKTKSCCKTSTSSGPKDSVKDINLSGGQCSWCGKYGHLRGHCPLLK